MLWVRSQDRMNLIKVNQIGINYHNNKQIIGNYQPELFENSGEYYEELGNYSSKERAIEVLDEIQNFIEKQGTSDAQTNEVGAITNIKYYGRVYEMPQK